MSDVCDVPRAHEGHGHIAVDERGVAIGLVVLGTCLRGETGAHQVDVPSHRLNALRAVEGGLLEVRAHEIAAPRPEQDGPVVKKVPRLVSGNGDGCAGSANLHDFLGSRDQLVKGRGRLQLGLGEVVLVVEQAAGFGEPRHTVADTLIGGRLVVRRHECSRAAELGRIQPDQAIHRRKLRVPGGAYLYNVGALTARDGSDQPCPGITPSDDLVVDGDTGLLAELLRRRVEPYYVHIIGRVRHEPEGELTGCA
ncbi:MAG: hypothetical protein BWY85_01464 [Firmicutes bacterium ADurb.Bin506]|nr:MAG: hypothetical protein BWY85_01464 [Firmicutes bacterium ADurb.Bin506]